MWFQRLLYKRRWRQLRDRGAPEAPTPDAFGVYVPLLEPQHFRSYRPERGLKITVEVAVGNIRHLLDHLDKVINTLFHRDNIKARDRLERHHTQVLRLDDYLVDAEQHPQVPKEIAHELSTRIIRIRDLLHDLSQDPEQEYRYKYYQRHYTHLLQEIHVVVMGIIEAS